MAKICMCFLKASKFWGLPRLTFATVGGWWLYNLTSNWRLVWQFGYGCHPFPRTFFDAISMIEKSTLFPRSYFFRCTLSGRNRHVVFTYFFRCNFDRQKFDIVFGKMKTFEEVFPVFVTLNTWVLQDGSL